MHTAGARALREDDNEMSREAVLLQWEQKIEAAERREEEDRVEVEATALDPPERRASGRFARTPQESDSPTAGKPALQLVEPEASSQASRFEHTLDTPEPSRQRRTITITGQPTPAPRRRSLVEAQIAQPDRIALWAFLLGLFLVVVAAGTAHA
jgi:hypothetical protein